MKNWVKFFGWIIVAFVFSFAVKAGADAESVQVSGVQQTDCSDTSVTVQWNSVLTADEYRYTISDGAGILPGQTSSTYTTISGLATGSSYTFSVAAYLDGQQIAEASTIEVTTRPNTTNFKVSQTGAATKSVTLTMSGAIGANYYIIATTASDHPQVAAGSKSTIQVKSLKANTKYSYVVYAARRSANGFVAYSAEENFKEVQAKTLTNALKAKNFDVSDTDFNANLYHFALKNTYNADGYQLQFRNMKGKTKKTITTYGMGKTKVENFINGHFYKYRVRTFVTCGTQNIYSKWSANNYIGLAKKSSGKINSYAIRLSWGKVTDAKKFNVYISTKEKSGFKKAGTVSPSKRSIKITRVNNRRLQRKRKYYVHIQAVALDGSKTVKSSFVNVNTFN